MLEYVFFHPVPFDKFIEFAKEIGLSPETVSDDESYEVHLPEDIGFGVTGFGVRVNTPSETPWGPVLQ